MSGWQIVAGFSLTLLRVRRRASTGKPRNAPPSATQLIRKRLEGPTP